LLKLFKLYAFVLVSLFISIIFPFIYSVYSHFGLIPLKKSPFSLNFIILYSWEACIIQDFIFNFRTSRFGGFTPLQNCNLHTILRYTKSPFHPQ